MLSYMHLFVFVLQKDALFFSPGQNLKTVHTDLETVVIYNAMTL